MNRWKRIIQSLGYSKNIRICIYNSYWAAINLLSTGINKRCRYCRHFEFGNVTWSRVDQSDVFRRWNSISMGLCRAGARAIRDKCEQSLNNHGNDCKDAPSRTCTLSRQWRNLSNLLHLNLSDAANSYVSKILKASVRNVYCWFTNICFGDWELPNAKSCEAIVSWSLKHN